MHLLITLVTGGATDTTGDTGITLCCFLTTVIYCTQLNIIDTDVVD